MMCLISMFFFKQKTADEMRIIDWISDVCSSDLMDGFIRWAGLTLEDNEEMVRQIIESRANAVLRWTGLDERISGSVLDGLYRLLAEVLVDPAHPLRSKIEEGLQNLANDRSEEHTSEIQSLMRISYAVFC